MLNLKISMIAAALVAGASANAVSEKKVLITNCGSDIIAYKYVQSLFREPEITNLFSVISDEWKDWCDGQGKWETIEAKTATCERIIQTNVNLDRKVVNGRKITTIVYGRRIGDRYYPPGGSEALANIGNEDAQFVRYDRKTLDFSLGTVVKKRHQFLAPRGSQYTSADTALDDAYYRTLMISNFTSHHQTACVF